MVTPQRTLCITGQRASDISTVWTNWSSPSSPSQTIGLSLRWWTSNLVSIHLFFCVLLQLSGLVPVQPVSKFYVSHTILSFALALLLVSENSVDSFWSKDFFLTLGTSEDIFYAQKESIKSGLLLRRAGGLVDVRDCRWEKIACNAILCLTSWRFATRGTSMKADGLW